MTNPTTTHSPAGSTWAFLTQRPVTWRQASEGSAVLAALGASAMAAAALVKVARVAASRRA